MDYLNRARSAELFRDRFPAMRALAYAFLGNNAEAEDTAMEAFVRVHSTWWRIRDPERADAYLHGDRRQPVPDAPWPQEDRDECAVDSQAGERRRRPAHGTSESHERSRAVWIAVSSLPDRQRACVVLVTSTTSPRPKLRTCSAARWARSRPNSTVLEQSSQPL